MDILVKRIEWIDFAKTICIICVVLGHSHVPPEYKSFIYVFHIPVFFFMSGAIFSFEKYPIYKLFLKRKINQLLIPYLLINLLTYLFWFLIGRELGRDVDLDLNPLKPLLGICSGIPYDHFLEHNIPLWF